MHCKECTRGGCSNTELSDCLASSRCSSVHMQCLYKWRLIMSSAAESLQTAISAPPHPTTPTQNISPSVQVRMTHFQLHWTARAFFFFDWLTSCCWKGYFQESLGAILAWEVLYWRTPARLDLLYITVKQSDSIRLPLRLPDFSWWCFSRVARPPFGNRITIWDRKCGLKRVFLFFFPFLCWLQALKSSNRGCRFLLSL